MTKALKDYQQRHDLPTTGVLDRATAKSLDDENGLALPDVSVAPPGGKTPVEEKTPSSSPPQTPVATAPPEDRELKPEISSPSPSQTPEPEATATAPMSSPSEITSPTPAPPSPTPGISPSASAESPSPTPTPVISPSPPEEAPPQFTVERVTKFLRNFLEAGEGKTVSPQLRYYSFPVNYLNHGKVNQQFVRNDMLRSMRRWPRRSYKLTGPVTISPVNAEMATADFTISYVLQRGKQRTSGRRGNRVTLREIKGALKIVAIKEQRAND